MKSRLLTNKTLQFISFVMIFAQQSFSQPKVPPKPIEEDFTWWYVTLFALILGLGGAIFWKFTSKKAAAIVEEGKRKAGKKDNSDVSFDADEEMEWLRKNQNIVDRKRRKAPKKQPSINLPKTSTILQGSVIESKSDVPFSFDELNSIPLPVFEFSKIKSSKPYNQLPISNDEALISAIEQTHDEYEEDEEIRE